MSAININKNNFENEVLNSDKTVLLDFWASWESANPNVFRIARVASQRSNSQVSHYIVQKKHLQKNWSPVGGQFFVYL